MIPLLLHRSNQARETQIMPIATRLIRKFAHTYRTLSDTSIPGLLAHRPPVRG